MRAQSVKNHVKMNKTAYKLPDVKNVLIESIERVDQVMWKNFIEHTKKDEKKFWDIDNIIDEVLVAKVSNLTMTITGDTSSSDFESQSD